MNSRVCLLYSGWGSPWHLRCISPRKDPNPYLANWDESIAASKDFRKSSSVTREKVLISLFRLPTAISDHCYLTHFLFKIVMNSSSELVFFFLLWEDPQTIYWFQFLSSFANGLSNDCLLFLETLFPFNQLGHGEKSARSHLLWYLSDTDWLVLYWWFSDSGKESFPCITIRIMKGLSCYLDLPVFKWTGILFQST